MMPTNNVVPLGATSMLGAKGEGDSGEAEGVARALQKRAASDPKPMLLIKAAEMLLRRCSCVEPLARPCQD
jgi:hypothetical protein